MSLMDTLLEKSIHPEITHLRHGSHPGRNWWLKTICPDPRLERLDVHGYGRRWAELSQRLPYLVVMTNTAYDWFGNPIGYSCSVWLRDGIDVRMRNIGANDLHLTVIDDMQGMRDSIEQLRDAQYGSEDIYQSLEDEIRTKESHLARQQLQVIDGKCN